MDNVDKTRFVQAFMAMAEIYNRELTSSLMTMYFEDLMDFSIDAVLEALRGHRRDPERGQFFPKPADLIDKLEGSSKEQALEAWPEVLRLASNSRCAVAADPISQQVVLDMGGWRRFGMVDAKELSWMQREFLERYSSTLRRGGPELLRSPGKQPTRLGEPIPINRLVERVVTP